MWNINKLKRSKPKNGPFLIMVFIDMLLLTAVLFLMSHVQQLLNLDVRINLTEIVTQNKDVITSRLRLEVNSLDLIAEQLAERYSKLPNGTIAAHKDEFLDYIAGKDEGEISWSGREGIAVFEDGREIDISGRRYFKLALVGTSNISERTVSRLNGEDIFVISVPVKLRGEIIGTVQRQYTPQQVYDICSVSLFSEKGAMYIINSDGYILVSSDQEMYNREADNYYRILYLANPEASKLLETDIRSGLDGFMETTVNGTTQFSAYTAITEVYDWYLITSVSTDAVSPNASVVIRMFYIVLISVVLIAACSMFYFLHLKNKQQHALEQIAFIDTVTQGGTFAKFAFDLQGLLQTLPNKTFYIFTFDIDNFRFINSYYGFEAGNNILRNIYCHFHVKLMGNESLVRVHGDHFVALLEDASDERINELFAPELSFDGIQIYLSAGLYMVTDKDESVNLMMDKASMAARKIKGMRFKRVEIYSDEFAREMTHNEQMKRSMEQALASEEIIPYFQPKVDINTRELVGAEALARWMRLDGTLVSPGEFIPVCERTGLIVSVDMAIFEQTLQFIRRNLNKGVRCVPISVNFSRMHLLNKEFLNKLLGKLRAYEIPPGMIEIELTETVIFDNYESINEFIGELHANGLQISMDDFGSGYSSLHMLKDVNIDVLKIDGGFLRGTTNSDRQSAIFGMMIQLAKKLNIKIVVEGVETTENISLMKEFDCAIAQGYYYARPMDAGAFDIIYEKGRVE